MARWGRFLSPGVSAGAALLTFSAEPFFPDLEDPGGKALVSCVAVDVFGCLVLVLGPSWMVADTENESFRNGVEPLRAFVFGSVPVLWLCLRGLELELEGPGGS